MESGEGGGLQGGREEPGGRAEGRRRQFKPQRRRGSNAARGTAQTPVEIRFGQLKGGGRARVAASC